MHQALLNAPQPPITPGSYVTKVGDRCVVAKVEAPPPGAPPPSFLATYILADVVRGSIPDGYTLLTKTVNTILGETLSTEDDALTVRLRSPRVERRAVSHMPIPAVS